MSYDLMVFEPSDVPHTKDAFLIWFSSYGDSEEDSALDPKVSSSKLQAWFHDVRVSFPAMNGPFGVQNEHDTSNVTDYSFGKACIVGMFAWSVATDAHETAKTLAEKHGLGFFAYSDEGTVWMPDSSGTLSITFDLSS